MPESGSAKPYPACSSCLEPVSEGFREWAGRGLGMPGLGCLCPLGVRNARPGGAGKGVGPLPAPYTLAQPLPRGSVRQCQAERLAGGQCGSQAQLVTLCLSSGGCLVSRRLTTYGHPPLGSLTGERGKPFERNIPAGEPEGLVVRFVLLKGLFPFPF